MVGRLRFLGQRHGDLRLEDIRCQRSPPSFVPCYSHKFMTHKHNRPPGGGMLRMVKDRLASWRQSAHTATIACGSKVIAGRIHDTRPD